MRQSVLPPLNNRRIVVCGCKQQLVVGVGPGHALVTHLPQRLRPAAALLAAAAMLLGTIGTSDSSRRLGLLLCCRGSIAGLMLMRSRRRRRWSSGARELLDDRAELGGVDDVHRRVRGVPAPPVRPRRRPAAARCVGGLLLLLAAATALH
jgi:hypothetical protein